MNLKKILIIGAGPSGLTFARVMADQGHQVVIFEERNHIGGNCHDEYDEHGVLIHRYGPHYFRTNSLELMNWLSTFTQWLPASYIVRSSLEGKLYPFPISLATLTQLKGQLFSENLMKDYLNTQCLKYKTPENSEEQCLNLVGQELYELFFKNYTLKQWGIHPKELGASITARIPLRMDFNDRYVNEKYQFMPAQGFHKLFQSMASSPLITILLNEKTQRKKIEELKQDFDLTLYTGPLDAFFDYQWGKLPYRSLQFEFKHYPDYFKQPCVQINYPNSEIYTRSVEIKHITQQNIQGTTLSYEIPTDKGDPFYPIINTENTQLHEKYWELSQHEKRKKNPVLFLGRLAQYRYFNMDHIFLNALKMAKTVLEEWNHGHTFFSSHADE
jgi:UDP-galactopyranose mutase